MSTKPEMRKDVPERVLRRNVLDFFSPRRLAEAGVSTTSEITRIRNALNFEELGSGTMRKLIKRSRQKRDYHAWVYRSNPAALLRWGHVYFRDIPGIGLKAEMCLVAAINMA